MVKVKKVGTRYQLESNCDKEFYDGKIRVLVEVFDDKITLVNQNNGNNDFRFKQSDKSVVKAFAEILNKVTKLEG